MTAGALSDGLLREANAEAEAAALAKGYRGAYAKAYIEGFAEGYAKGLRVILAVSRDNLVHRFGALTPQQEARLRGASLDTLSRWFKSSLTAPSIDAALAN